MLSQSYHKNLVHHKSKRRKNLHKQIMKLSMTTTILIIAAGLSRLTQGFAPPSLGSQRTHLQSTLVPGSDRTTPTSLQSAMVQTTEFSQYQSNSVQFPPPLDKIGRMKRAVKFWINTAPIVADYYRLKAMIELQKFHGKVISDQEIEESWNAQHEVGAEKLAATISDMKGFYVKASQIIATRGDLFPQQYTDRLNSFSDNLDPMPTEMVKEIIVQELLLQKNEESFDDVFAEFDSEPLGAASIAQVHRAVLTEKYGGREVAVKVQRPSIESKLMGDVANLKMIAKLLKDTDISPVDYYAIFQELEVQLADEFDFLEEAKAMDSIHASLEKSFDGSYKTENPVVIPRSVPGLVSSRVLVMDYLKGTSVSRAQEKMRQAGINPESLRARVFGKKLVQDLTYVFGRNILETGSFHADPHPGNLFILDDGKIGLIDFGQVKQLSQTYRETIGKIVIALDDRQGDDDEEFLETVTALLSELGVELKDGAKPQAAAAVAMWLFDGSVEELPGGYDISELSDNSPVKEIQVMPQELVLVARSSVLIKALARRFGLRWSLAKQWAPVAREVLDGPSTKTSHDMTWFGRSAKNMITRGRRLAGAIIKKLSRRNAQSAAAFLE